MWNPNWQEVVSVGSVLVQQSSKLSQHVYPEQIQLMVRARIELKNTNIKNGTHSIQNHYLLYYIVASIKQQQQQQQEQQMRTSGQKGITFNILLPQIISHAQNIIIVTVLAEDIIGTPFQTKDNNNNINPYFPVV